MEGGDPDEFSKGVKGLDSFPHFPASLVCKGNTEDLLRSRKTTREDMGDPVSDNSGLPASCSRKDQERTFCMENRFFLGRVKREKIGGEVHSTVTLFARFRG
jgi:hypothetical protein